jgi:periplasmic protein TonB
VLVELAPAPAAPDTEQMDVAPAPEEMVEQKPTPTEVEKQPDQPKVEDPPPPEVSASVALPVERPPVKEEEERKAPSPITTAPAQAKSKSDTAASPGIGANGTRVIAPAWRDRLVEHLQHYKRYPGEARARHEEGVVLLSFSVDRDGHVIEHHIVNSSGHPDLDAEVMDMIERAQPLPAFPASMTQARLDLTVPIRFSLR